MSLFANLNLNITIQKAMSESNSSVKVGSIQDEQQDNKREAASKMSAPLVPQRGQFATDPRDPKNNRKLQGDLGKHPSEVISEHTNAPQVRNATLRIESEDGICNRRGSQASMTNTGEQEEQVHSPVAEHDDLRSQAQVTDGGVRIATGIHRLRDSQRNENKSSMVYNSANAMLNDPSKQEFEPHTANQTPNAVMQHERPEQMALNSPELEFSTRNKGGHTVKAANYPKHLSSYDQVSNGLVSDHTRLNMQQQSEPILQVYSMDKQSEEQTVQCAAGKRNSDYFGSSGQIGLQEVNTPSAITDQVGRNDRCDASVKAFGYEIESGQKGAIQVSPYRFKQDSQVKEVVDYGLNVDNQLESNKQASIGPHFEGESIAEEYVNELIHHTRDGPDKQLQAEQDYAQQLQQCSIGRNSDEDCSQKEQLEVVSNDNDLRIKSHIHTDDSQQHTRSAFEQPNFVQQCTDPSDENNGKANQDSQQSSAVSQYFRQSETDEMNQEDLLMGPQADSISRQVIMEADEYQYAELLDQQEQQQHRHIQLLNQLEIQDPHEIAERDQHEESDSHPAPTAYDKGHVREFSITENSKEDMHANMADNLPSQTDPEGLEYSASAMDGGPASFDGRSQLQQQTGHKSGEIYTVLEQTPQFVMKQNSNTASAHDPHPEEQLEQARKFELADTPIKEHIQQEEAGITLETRDQPDSIGYSDQFGSLVVQNKHPYEQVEDEKAEPQPAATRPLNFRNIMQVNKSGEPRYSNEHMAEALASQDYGMFDIAKGNDSGEIDPQREIEARQSRFGRVDRQANHSRVSSRFSQAACDELEKVAERINQSVELNLDSNSIEHAGNAHTAEAEHANTSEKVEQTRASIQSKKRASIDSKTRGQTKKTQKPPKKGKKKTGQKSQSNSRSRSRSRQPSIARVEDERNEDVYQINMSDSQKEGPINIVMKDAASALRKPPEVPALVMAARERAGRFKHNNNEVSTQSAASNSFPIRLQKRSLIKSPVLTSAAQAKHKLNFQFINSSRNKSKVNQGTISSRREEDREKSTARVPSENTAKKAKNTSSLSSSRKPKKPGERELKASKQKEPESASKSRSARRIVVNNMLRSHQFAQKVSPRQGSRQIQTANSMGRWNKRGVHAAQSIEGSSTAASGFNQTQSNFNQNNVSEMPRRPLSTDMTINLPVGQRIPLQNKLLNQRNRTDDVSPQINLKYSGISKEDIEGLSIDEIYRRMNNNLALNDQDFQARCHNVIHTSQTFAEEPIDLRAPKAQYKLLKARLMEADSIANRRASDFSQPAISKPTMFNSSSINMSQPLQNAEAAIFQQIPEIEEITQKEEPIHLEKGQFILYTTQPIGARTGIASNMPSSPAGVSLYSQNPNKMYAFQPKPAPINSSKPNSSYNTRPFRQLTAMTPNSQTSYESFFKFKPVTNPQINANFAQTKSLVNVSNLLPTASNGAMSRANQRFVSTGRKWNSKEQATGGEGAANRHDPRKDRASTANNYKSRGLAEALKPEKNFSANSIGKLRVQQNNYSQSNTGLGPNRLQDKLQYRSLRGRKIQEFLAQVKSQKLNQNLLSDQTSVDIKIYKPSDDVQSREYEQEECFSETVKSQQRYNAFDQTDKSKKFLNSVDESLNQIESNPDIQDVYNSQTANHQRKGSVLKDTMNSTISSQLMAARPSQLNDSIILSNFLAQQDKRIDFGSSELFQKVENGEPLDLQNSSETSKVPLTSEELEGLISLVRRNTNEQVQTRDFQIRSHDKIMGTLSVLMNEIGLGYRVDRMQRDESQKNLERCYVLACRAHKLYKARQTLISIFSQIVYLRQEMPIVKKQLLSLIQDKSKDAKKLKQRRPTQDQVEVLTSQADNLKVLISSLVFDVQNLLRTFKFFNQSFVLDDKDFLKYLSKETNEMKGLFAVFNIPFQ